MDAVYAPEISKVMVLSTCHIPEPVALSPENYTIATPAKRNGGFLIPTYLATQLFPETSDPALLTCMQFARKYGCKYILFDRDGPTQPELPVFNW